MTLPSIALLSTGGTIAMGGREGDANATSLAASVPNLGLLANIETVDVLAKPSATFSWSDIVRISRAVDDAARRHDGVVVTHGTDTLEETAFALTLTTRRRQPIVLTCAMRRSDQPGADGPANILAAVHVAASKCAQDKGVLVVCDDEIHSGSLVRKVHAFRTHAFSSAPFGPIGWVAEGRVRFSLAPAQEWPLIPAKEKDVVVPILEAGPGLEPATIEALSGVVHALVLSLPGAGHVSADCCAILDRLSKAMPVVFASRTGGGETLRHSYTFAGSEVDLLARGLIGAGPLDARKARVALQLLLASGASIDEVRQFFLVL